MRYVIVLLLVALLTPAVWAQEGSEIGELKVRYAEAVKTWQQEYRAARKDGVPRNEWPKHPAKEFYAEFKGIVFSAEKGSATSGEALTWMLQNLQWVSTNRRSYAKKQRQLADKLLANHVEQPCMAAVAKTLSSPSPKDKAKHVESLDLILAKNKHPKARAEALFAKAQCLASKSANPTKGELQMARDSLKLLLAKHGETAAARRARPFDFELNHLQIGQVAPDFETADIDGVAFKLSDYRGKVVVLDFWGFW